MPNDPVPAEEPVLPPPPDDGADVDSVQAAMQAAENAVAEAVAGMKHAQKA